MRSRHGLTLVGASLLVLGTPDRPTPGDPVPDIDVAVQQVSGGEAQHALTDAHGVFSLTLPAGEYIVRIASEPTPRGGGAAPASPGGGAAIGGKAIVLPDSVKGRGGWPYQVQLTEVAAVTKVGLAPAQLSPRVRNNAPNARGLELRVRLGPLGGGAGNFVLRGRVESRS